MAKHRTRTAFAALAVLVGASACSGGGQAAPEPDKGKDSDSGRAAIRVGDADALADRPTGVRITGLTPHQRVTVAAGAKDQRNLPWASRAVFTANGDGVVDLSEQAPRGGRPYAKPDSLGLLSSMLPQAEQPAKLIGSGRAFSFHPPAPAEKAGYSVRWKVTDGSGRELTERDVTRRWLADGVGHRRLTPAKDKVDAELYTPPEGSPKKAPVLVFGGSEGGNAGEYAAALLASRGHPAMSLCYFDCGRGSDRPASLEDIDLGYFTRAAKLLAEEPSADGKKLAVMGNSRGSEVAQLLGQRHPHLVRDVVAYAPSAKVNGPYSPPGATLHGTSAWQENGKRIPQSEIPLDRVRGTVLAVGGTNDKMWGAADASESIAARRNASGEHHRKLVYEGAGHHVNWFPYGQPGQEGGADGAVGSTSAADRHAREHGWPQVLKLLER